MAVLINNYHAHLCNGKCIQYTRERKIKRRLRIVYACVIHLERTSATNKRRISHSWSCVLHFICRKSAAMRVWALLVALLTEGLFVNAGVLPVEHQFLGSGKCNGK